MKETLISLVSVINQRDNTSQKDQATGEAETPKISHLNLTKSSTTRDTVHYPATPPPPHTHTG